MNFKLNKDPNPEPHKKYKYCTSVEFNNGVLDFKYLVGTHHITTIFKDDGISSKNVGYCDSNTAIIITRKLL